VSTRQGEVDVIEQTEELRPELDVARVIERKTLRHSHVNIGLSRPAEAVTTDVADVRSTVAGKRRPFGTRDGLPLTLDEEGSNRPSERGRVDARLEDAHGIGGVPLTEIAVAAFEDQARIAGPGPYLFPSEKSQLEHQVTFKTAGTATLRRAKVPYFRIYDLRSTYATGWARAGWRTSVSPSSCGEATPRSSRSTRR